MINIIYWSMTGNTEAMAEAVKAGVIEAGGSAELINVSDADVSSLESASVFALGCPAMGAEVLEEDEFEPFVEQVCEIASGKKIALFGSYGWGDGEWMRNWEDRMKEAGAELVGDNGLIVNEEPDAEGIEKCKELGKLCAKI